MKHAIRLSGALVAGLMWLGATGVFAQDWPQWRGPNRDGKVTGFSAPKAWPKDVTPVWKVLVGEGDATPALLDDKIYVFARQEANEVLLCLRASDGRELWRSQYPVPDVTGPARRHRGPRSSPAVAKGKIVTLGVSGILSCFDLATGERLWQKNEFPDAVPRFFTSYSPLIVNGLVVAHLGGPGRGAMVAYDLATGAPAWRWAGGEGPAYASPVLMTVAGTKMIVKLTEKSAIGIAAADGKLLWRLPFEPKGMAYNAATPIVDGETVIFMGAGRGTRAVKIERLAEGFGARELWGNEKLAPQFATPVLKDGMLYGLNDRGFLYCMDARDGHQAWMNDIKRGGTFAALLDAGPVILALPCTSELVAFRPMATRYEEVAQLKVADTPTYAYPVVAGKRIFIKDYETLSMIEIK